MKTHLDTTLKLRILDIENKLDELNQIHWDLFYRVATYNEQEDIDDLNSVEEEINLLIKEFNFTREQYHGYYTG